MKKLLLLALFLALNLPSAQAIIAEQEDPEGHLPEPNPVYEEFKIAVESFQNYKRVTLPELRVPTVVELPLDGETGFDFAIVNNGTYEFEAYLVHTEMTASSPDLIAPDEKLTDGDTSTYVQYDLPEQGKGTVTLELSASEGFSAHTFSLLLDNYVALPSSIEIRAAVDGEVKVVLAKTPLTGRVVNFPETYADTWMVTLEYTQPLRIAELSLLPGTTDSNVLKSIRFLAHPGSWYTVYFNADRPVDIETKESGDLTSEEGLVILDAAETVLSPFYVQADGDADGLVDELDNCVNIANSDQTDVDENGRGDACDDFDRDGRVNGEDNCINDANKNQADEDGDSIGDVCDDEESRLTEKHPFLPWLGIGAALLIIGGLFYKTVKK